MDYVPDYEHIRCDECNGTIGFYDRKFIPTCERCGKVFKLYQLTYNRLMINDKTGWIFPVKDKKEVL